MDTILWLDDVRNPKDFIRSHNNVKTIWVKSYIEFTEYITSKGLPDIVYFDHDLGKNSALSYRKQGYTKKEARRRSKKELTGYDCAVWLTNYCSKNGLKLPIFFSQSYNPVGKKRILNHLTNFQIQE